MAGHPGAPLAISGLELLDKLQSSRILPTGCPSIDYLLGGGLREGHVTEVLGLPRAGKTALCLGAAAETAGRGEGVLWLDGTGAFSATRLATTMRRIGASREAADAALERVLVRRVHTTDDAIAALLGAAPDSGGEGVGGGKGDGGGEGIGDGGHDGAVPHCRLIVLDGAHSVTRSLAGEAVAGAATVRALADSLQRAAAGLGAACLTTNGWEMAAAGEREGAEGSVPAARGPFASWDSEGNVVVRAGVPRLPPTPRGAGAALAPSAPLAGVSPALGVPWQSAAHERVLLEAGEEGGCSGSSGGGGALGPGRPPSARGDVPTWSPGTAGRPGSGSGRLSRPPDRRVLPGMATLLAATAAPSGGAVPFELCGGDLLAPAGWKPAAVEA